MRQFHAAGGECVDDGVGDQGGAHCYSGAVYGWGGGECCRVRGGGGGGDGVVFVGEMMGEWCDGEMVSWWFLHKGLVMAVCEHQCGTRT